MSSTIEWTLEPPDFKIGGENWNPGVGCDGPQKTGSPGCRRCWAARAAHLHAPNIAAHQGLTELGPDGPRFNGIVRLVPERMSQPLHWKRPRKVATCLMGDLFSEGMPFECIAAVFGVMAAARRHTFMMLTKNPARALKWFEWLEAAARRTRSSLFPDEDLDWCRVHVLRAAALRNGADSLLMSGYTDMLEAGFPLGNVWLGTSVSNQLDVQRKVDDLIACPAVVHWISAEPLLKPIEFTERMLSRIDMIAGGCESGPGRRHIVHGAFRLLRDQCRAMNVAFFLKQMAENEDGSGKVISMPELDGERWAMFPVERR